MFCPNCGQQQAADELRFCSRCGYQLGVVKAILAAGDPAPAPPAPDPAQRKKDMTVGAALMFLVAFLAAGLTINFPPSTSGRILLLLAFWILLTLAINLRPLWRYFVGGGGAARETKGEGASPRRLADAPPVASLPPAQSTPVSSVREPRFDTSEVVQPPSVAERTTNLLGGQ